MITGVVNATVIRRIACPIDNGRVFACLIDMAIKRPHRPVTEGADDEPNYKNALEHAESLHHIKGMFGGIGS